MSAHIAVRSTRKSDRSLKKTVLQIVRFCVVGGLNTGIDVVLFNVLVWIFPTNDMYILIFLNSLAYFTGALNSFFLNKFWTFRQRSSATGDQVMRFVMVTSLGIICNDAFLWLATAILTSLSLQNFFGEYCKN